MAPEPSAILGGMSTNPLEQARQHFMDGVAHHEQGRHAQAEQSFLAALALAPGRPSVLANLGLARLALGRPAEAMADFRQSLAADAAQPDLWAALAQLQADQKDWRAALESAAQALRHGESEPSLQRLCAEWHLRLGDAASALAAYRKAVALTPDDAAAWAGLGSLQRDLGQLADAAESFQRARDLGADAALMDYYLAAVRGQTQTAPPRRYVQGLFDDYAPEFEQHLVGQLGYRAHLELVALLPPERRFARCLDLGCGTGLCGRAVQPVVGHITGIDLAPRMIEEASRLGGYDLLEAADLHEFLRRPGPSYDLVTATDVFIYVGDLEPVFAALAPRMMPGGLLAFTLEDAPEGTGLQLQASLRYAHDPVQVRAQASQAGFVVLTEKQAPIRQQQRNPVMGRYLLLKRME